jgi:hypothetical protein
MSCLKCQRTFYQGGVCAPPAHGRTESKNGQIKNASSRQLKQTFPRLGTVTIMCLAESFLEAEHPKVHFILLLINCYAALAVRVSEPF